VFAMSSVSGLSEPTRWKPSSVYYHIDHRGSIHAARWSDCEVDHQRWQFGNCFRTAQEAQQAREKVKEVLRNFHREHP
jgi:hypothetical protein